MKNAPVKQKPKVSALFCTLLAGFSWLNCILIVTTLSRCLCAVLFSWFVPDSIEVCLGVLLTVLRVSCCCC